MAKADSEVRASTVETIGYAAVERSAWDEAFTLASEFRCGRAAECSLRVEPKTTSYQRAD